MKKVIVLINDNRKPCREISSITGKKSFGNTIYKRISLKKRLVDAFVDDESVVLAEDEIEFAGRAVKIYDSAVVMLYTDFIVTDSKELKIITKKACFSHENYRLICEGRLCGVIFADVNGYLRSSEQDYEKYSEVATTAFKDISDPTAFRNYITGGFDARFFNMLSGDDHTVIKKSENLEKIKKEYEFYYLLPEDMKQWFVRPYDYKEEGNVASYTMKRYHMTDLAIRYVHGAIKTTEFDEIMDNLFYFIAHRKVKKVSVEEYEFAATGLYIAKAEERVAKLKTMEGYDQIAQSIATLTPYKDIDEIIEKYKGLYKSIRTGKKFEPVQVVGHGDLCFSNILYNHDANLCMLIDPRGALTEDDLYMDPYYDLAKLSHSVCGHYDYFNSDLYTIVMDSNMQARINVDCDNREYVRIFKSYLEKNGLDLRLIRLYEASLFLSMLPLHMDRPQKVFAFILNAVAILESLSRD